MTYAHAADILNIYVSAVGKLVSAGALTSHGGKGALTAARSRPWLRNVTNQPVSGTRYGTRPNRSELWRGSVVGAMRPPDDVHEWLTEAAAALVLGVTRQAVRQRISRNTIPFETHAGQVWLRRDLVEMRERCRRVQLVRRVRCGTSPSTEATAVFGPCGPKELARTRRHVLFTAALHPAVGPAL